MPSKDQTHSNDDKASAKWQSRQPITEDLELAQQQTPEATTIQKVRLDPRSLTPREVLQLQRMIGNRAVGKLLVQPAQRQPIQKNVNDDIGLEREADLMTDMVTTSARIGS